MSPRFACSSLLSLLITLTACGDAGGGETTSATETGGDLTTTMTPTTTTATPTGSGGPEQCGDGEIDAGEVCDGDNLGGKQCADVDAAFVGGVLACGADCGSFDASGCEQDPGASLLVLNEVSSKGAEEGQYAGLGDAIELYNAGGAEVDLTGFLLSDDPAFPVDKTYVFPPGSTLAPGAYRVLVTLDDVTLVGDFPFGISSTNEETITLADAGGVTVDQLVVQGADAAVSYCRLPDGTGAWQTCDLTLGEANVAASQTCGDAKIDGTEQCDGAELAGETCQSLGFMAGTLTCSTGCVLDASMCDSGSMVAINELESVEDRIEIHNAGDVEVDIAGWIVTDDNVDENYDPVADTEKAQFSAGSKLAAGEFLVVAKGTLDGQHPFGLGGDGDTVTLLDADLKLISRVTYGQNQAEVSFCRLPDGPTGAWAADCTPTLGLANKK